MTHNTEQPTLDTEGEWRLGASDDRCVFNATGNLIASTNSKRIAAQIVADHNAKALLVEALRSAADRLSASTQWKTADGQAVPLPVLIEMRHAENTLRAALKAAGAHQGNQS